MELYLFVGAPKVGKSFFMAQLGYHVSMGIPLWGFPVTKGTVLYLALEDDYARLQRRLSKMFGMEGSSNLHFATQSKVLNQGLEEQLHKFVKEHEDARLIIMDTLQKVREASGDKLSYGNDYEIVTNGYVEVYYKDGNMLMLKCDEVESRLRLTEHSQSKIWKLLDENPIEYVSMALSGEMQQYCDIEDDMVKSSHDLLLQQYLDLGYNQATAEALIREFNRYVS